MFIEELERLERKEKFIEKAKLKYGNKFDYSKVKYINSIIEVTIICNSHKKEFSQKPVKHLQNKHNCPQCAKEAYSDKRRIKKQDFIKEANKVHNNNYSYEKSIPKTKSDKVVIFCKKHKNYFEQRLNVHLKGYVGCKKCINEIKNQTNKEIFKQRFINSFVKKFGIDYDFLDVDYINNNTAVKVYCKQHNTYFLQVPRNIFRAKTCSCNQCKHENLRKTIKF